jgi:hypothetical protein
MMKLLIAFLLFSKTLLAADPYQKQLNRLKKEMEKFGIQVGVFSSNPFQTGTALSSYYLDQKTLLLQRDTFFQLRCNTLQSTEQLADFQHRTKVLKMHANNMLIQLSKAIQNQNKDGLLVLEPQKNKEAMDQLIKECEGNSQCMSKKAQLESNRRDYLIENIELSSVILKQMPYMHFFEVMGVYQLIQLLYMEVLYSQSTMSKIEVELFRQKHQTLYKNILNNPQLTNLEREFQKELIIKTVNTWRKKVLYNKNERKREFQTLAQKMLNANEKLAREINLIEVVNKDLLHPRLNSKNCRKKWKGRRKTWCQSLVRLQEVQADAIKRTTYFQGIPEPSLPDFFWEIGE